MVCHEKYKESYQGIWFNHNRFLIKKKSVR